MKSIHVMKKSWFSIYLILSLLFLVYLLVPGPRKISDFPELPRSFRSKLSGDTIQVPNVMAFFSDNYRDFVAPFYYKDYARKTFLPFLPLKLNYPPEYAFKAIKDQTMSTYLEEFIYPLRDSIFVNGWEPLEKDGTPRYKGAGTFGVEGKDYDTKVTLRYYPSLVLIRIIVWLGINVSFYLLYYSFKKVIYERH